jgi:CRISPR/Cas system-associated exonuclease Cas4 (RecB family)
MSRISSNEKEENPSSEKRSTAEDVSESKDRMMYPRIASATSAAHEHRNEEGRKRGIVSASDLREEYLSRMKVAAEEIVSKPREGIHVTDLVLCSRLGVFRAIDPLPISAKTVGILTTGMAVHGVTQWLFLSDRKRFEREKHLEFRGIRGSVDILDKIRNIPLEFKTTRASNILEPKPWHVQQLKYYMAILGASQGYMLYQLLVHFGDTPFKAFRITMNEKERKEQLDKLVEEADSLKKAKEARDPSLAKPVYADPVLNWLCRDCPYQVNCKKIQEAAAAA